MGLSHSHQHPHHHSHGHAHWQGHTSQSIHANQQAIERVTLLALSVSVLLVIIKLWGWSTTDSLSLMSSLADSLFDVLVSGMNYLAARYAFKPADDDHRFGHTGIEDIAGLTQFAFICGSMVLVIVQSAQAFYQPSPITHPEAGMVTMAISLLLTSGLVIYQQIVARRTRSLIVKSDALHYLGDILMNLSIIASFFLVAKFGYTWIDPLMACLIAAYIIKEACHIGLRAFNNLMNREMPEDEKAKIIAVLESTPEIRGHHDLRTRYSGIKPFIQMHIEVDRTLSFLAAHAIADQLEMRLVEIFPGADVIVHEDPV